MVSSIMASRPGPEAAPDHHTTPTMFDCWYDVLFMKSCVDFTPDVMGQAPSNTFCCINPQSIFPKDKPLCSFWSAMAFAIGTLPWMPFLPSLFLIVKS